MICHLKYEVKISSPIPINKTSGLRGCVLAPWQRVITESLSWSDFISATLLFHIAVAQGPERERDNLITACGRFSFRFIQRRAAERHVENCVVPPPEMVLCESSLVPWPLITRTHTHVRKFPRARLWHRSLAKRMTHACNSGGAQKCLITTHLHPGSSLLAASARSALNL
jgi:hypothetical protein